MHPTENSARNVWIGFCLGIAGFALIILLVLNDAVTDLERSMLLALRVANDLSDLIGPGWFEEAVAELTALGGFTIITLVTIFAVAILTMLGHGSAALYLAVVLGSATIVSNGLKLFFERQRPDIVPHIDRTFTASFPSGHAMMSMVTWLTIAAVTIRFVPRHELRILIVVSAILLSILIGASRVYLGVHWPTDVLAGWCAGLFWACGCWLMAHYINRRRTFGHSGV